MKKGRYPAIVALASTLGILSLGGPLAGFAQDETEASATEDVVYLNDGRTFHGKVLSEDNTSVRFEVHQMGQKSAMSFFKWDIARLDRNVAVTVEEETTANGPEDVFEENEAEAEVDLSLPGIYVVPLQGQMGTDIRPEIYEPIIEDIKEQNPAVVVFRLNSNAFEYGGGDYLEFETYRKLVQDFKRELGDTRQVVWVENSIGVSSVVALAWHEIYMMPQARLDGLAFVGAMTSEERWQDEDVREKMRAAWGGIVKAFLEFGEHDPDLGHAMMFPNAILSADFKGREVLWELDADGEVVIDNQDNVTAGFDAEDGRNLRISQETVDTLGEDDLADLAFILGFREYRKIDGIAEEDIEEYIKRWRESYGRCEAAMKDYEQVLGWAQGEDAKKFSAQALQKLQFILDQVEKFRAVEMELQRNYGINKLQLELMIRQLKERIKEITEQERQRNRDGSGGGPSPPGGGGGPRPG